MSLFFDLAKAFDTLKHDVLPKKMKQYVIGGPPLGNVDSKYLPIAMEVPQGSVLAPLLFIGQVNDTLKALKFFFYPICRWYNLDNRNTFDPLCSK